MVEDSPTHPATAAGLEDILPAPATADQFTAAVNHRMLIVDDNPGSADSLAMRLRRAGNDVRTAHDGRQALVVAENYQPDLVLLDIGLPGMDGDEVAQRLRAEPRFGLFAHTRGGSAASAAFSITARVG